MFRAARIRPVLSSVELKPNERFVLGDRHRL
jgi:hypothetical protein